jgi:uncharacterized damage-inducible protein DinB
MHSPTSSSRAAGADAQGTPVTAHSLARLLDVYTREHATTRKVLHAFPAAQADLRPSERSSPARQLAWTFVVEQRLMAQALRGEALKGYVPPPATWGEILEAFDRMHEEVVACLKQPNEKAGPARFFVGPKQMGDIPLHEFLWFMLHDQIHHRGQLSVYVRVAGGRLPAIYGPSADEPWT